MQDNNNNNNEVSRAERFENAHKRRRRRNKIWFVLACIVVFCTTYALILPAITLERPTYCGLEEHTHDASCYERVLTCGMAESAEHQHTDACYTEVLTCGKIEHTHTEACYVEPEQAAAKPDTASDGEPLPNAETPAANDETPAANAEGEAISTAAELKSKLEAGGTYYLANDIEANQVININGNVTLNLNGHTVTCTGLPSGQWTFINVSGNLTINGGNGDFGSIQESVRTVTGMDLNGNLATVTNNDDGTKTLVYYVTTATPNGTTTTDALEEHTVVIPAPDTAGGGLRVTGNIDNFVATVGNTSGTITVNGGLFSSANGGQINHYVRSNQRGHLTVAGGYFTGAKGEAVYNNNGFLDITGGIVTGNTDASHGGAGVYSNAGTVKIRGGYIIGNRTTGGDNIGGGVGINNGTLNISGGVIAGNRSGGNGGGVYMGSGTFTMSGGVIAGNSCPNNGGGVYMGGGTLNISDGYITNNTVPNFQGTQGGGSNGGGGLCMDNGTVNISGGTVSGNFSKNAGGGMYHKRGHLNMTGGTFASNYAEQGEGGAMRLGSWNNSRRNDPNYAMITAKIAADTTTDANNRIYITNNETKTSDSWGGGGIFVATQGVLGVTNAIVTENSAGGFGGGVGGCSTGRTYVLSTADDGAAIYANNAGGTNTTPRGSSWNQKPDDNFALENAVFMESGYKDFFCAMNSVVHDNMLGGGSENWTGSCDYEPVTVERGGSAVAGTMMGLTANPSGESISAALEKGTTFVSGNKSNNHGGGIMSNGVLLFGEADSLTVTPGLTIHGFKSFKVGGAEGAITDEQFTFLLINANSDTVSYENGELNYAPGDIVDTAKSTLEKDFLFSMLYEDNSMEVGSSKTYSYYLIEEKPQAATGIDYDSTVYRIAVTVQRKRSQVNSPSGNETLPVDAYVVTSATVTKNGTAISTQLENLNKDNHSASLVIGTENDATFKNTGEQPQFLRITKTDNFDHILNGVMFRMTDSDGNEVLPMSTINGENRDGKMWYPTNRNGNLVYQVFGNRTYYLYEEPREGYEPAGPWVIEIDSSADKASVYSATEANGSITKGDLIKEVSLGSGDNAHYFDYGIVNTAIPYELPKTGGAGTTAMYSLGALLILAAAVGAGYDLRHRRERRKH